MLRLWFLIYYCLQFGNLGLLEQHGFARNRFWSLDEDASPLPQANNQSTVDLILKSTEEDIKAWPRGYVHPFMICIRKMNMEGYYHLFTDDSFVQL